MKIKSKKARQGIEGDYIPVNGGESTVPDPPEPFNFIALKINGIV
ncbi:hypothetical protein [Sphingobacterium thalpophilum]